MGVYAITGASSGIGAKTKELLLQKGHEVINIDLKDGDICVNLATPEGRQAAVDKLHELHPEGLDGMICNAGVSGLRQSGTDHFPELFRNRSHCKRASMTSLRKNTAAA